MACGLRASKNKRFNMRLEGRRRSFLIQFHVVRGLKEEAAQGGCKACALIGCLEVLI